MVEITDAQQIRLNLLSTLNYDTAAAKVAVEFVQDSPLKYQLFIQQYSRVTSETEVVAKTMKAVQEATEALSSPARHYSRHSLSACDNAGLNCGTVVSPVNLSQTNRWG